MLRSISGDCEDHRASQVNGENNEFIGGVVEIDEELRDEDGDHGTDGDSDDEELTFFVEIRDDRDDESEADWSEEDAELMADVLPVVYVEFGQEEHHEVIGEVQSEENHGQLEEPEPEEATVNPRNDQEDMDDVGDDHVGLPIV